MRRWQEYGDLLPATPDEIHACGQDQEAIPKGGGGALSGRHHGHRGVPEQAQDHAHRSDYDNGRTAPGRRGDMAVAEASIGP